MCFSNWRRRCSPYLHCEVSNGASDVLKTGDIQDLSWMYLAAVSGHMQLDKKICGEHWRVCLLCSHSRAISAAPVCSTFKIWTFSKAHNNCSGQCGLSIGLYDWILYTISISALRWSLRGNCQASSYRSPCWSSGSLLAQTFAEH